MCGCLLQSKRGIRVQQNGKERRIRMQAMATNQMVNVDVIKGAVAEKIDAAGFTSWIAPIAFEIENGVLNCGVQNQFSFNYINAAYGNVLRNVVENFGLALNVYVAGTKRNASVAPVANDNNTQSFAPSIAPEANNTVAFDSFVATDDNVFVLSACKKIASGAASFSPLYIHGGAGCGKSLLAGCVKNASTGRVIMMNGGQFVSDFTRSLHDRTVFAFKDYCRNCDTFILDDVQGLAGKKATMDEFLQLVMDLKAAGKNVVLTANAAPNNLTGFDRRAQSLLASGLVADVVAPNAHVKSVLLRRAGVAADVANELANRIANDGHLVAGVATKIKTYSELMGASVDMDVASRLLADTLQRAKTPLAMVKNMCEKLGVSYDAVCGTGRSRNLVLARQTMMAVLKGATGLSLAEIGNYVGGRDHATVLYAVRQIEKQKANDLLLAAQIQQLINECK
ncbi:MAG: AAA family ATPase [Alphaproteobacteria bacterium]|nr:AAA family ATPase [Alphaproteobacteria bacterium]